MAKQFRAAVVQAEPVWLNADETIEKSIALIEEAAKNGAQIVGFPETWIPGYPFWLWLGSPAYGMQFIEKYYENSLRVDDPRIQRIADTARNNGINVVMGFSELDGGSLYMGQMTIAADGTRVANRRKLKPTHVERTLFGEGDGSDFGVHELNVGRVGALCCWEHWQPLSKYAMYSMNEQVHVASWPAFNIYRGAAYNISPEMNVAASQMYAAEGQCFVLASCITMSKSGIEFFCDTPDKEELLIPGGGYSMIFGPDGRPLAQPLAEDAEGIVYADIDLGQIALAKSAADPVGHYSRPDVVRLMLNKSASQRVMPFPTSIEPTNSISIEQEVVEEIEKESVEIKK